MDTLRGIFPALLTPYTADGKIDEAALRRLVRWNLDKGVDGFYVGGSTAEAFLMSSDERKQVLATVCDEAAGGCAVIAHVGSIGTAQAIDLARHAKGLAVDAISSIPPFYYPFTFEEIRGYYFDLADAVDDLPVILYNFPAHSGVTLDSENIGVFLRDRRFVGVKHTSSDFYALERFRQIRPDVVLYNGYDEMFVSGLAAGADGAIGSTVNIMAEKFISMRRLHEQGLIRQALAEQSRVNNIIQALLRVGVFAGEKAILTHLGIAFGMPRKPFRPLTAEQTDYLIGVYEDNTGLCKGGSA